MRREVTMRGPKTKNQILKIMHDFWMIGWLSACEIENLCAYNGPHIVCAQVFNFAWWKWTSHSKIVHDFDELILSVLCGASSLRSRATGSLACWHSQTASCKTGTCNPTMNGVNERGVTKNKSQRHASSCEIKLADYQYLGNLGRFRLRVPWTDYFSHRIQIESTLISHSHRCLHSFYALDTLPTF